MKTCTTCKLEKDFISFGKNRSSKDGLQYTCKLCRSERHKLERDKNSERHRKWRVSNAGKIKEQGVLYYKLNKEVIKKRSNAYYYNNLDLIKEKSKYYREHNKESISRKRKEYNEKNKDKNIERSKYHYYKNHERNLANKRKYHAEHKERANAKRRQWNKDNPERRRAQRWKYKAQRKTQLGFMPPNYHELLWKAQGGRCYYCSTPLEPGFHLEHKIPLSKGGLHDFYNVCLSCAGCNMSKGQKTDLEFAQFCVIIT